MVLTGTTSRTLYRHGNVYIYYLHDQQYWTYNLGLVFEAVVRSVISFQKAAIEVITNKVIKYGIC